jgi:hypothetical protein
VAERDRYRAALTEMACSVGWPKNADEHVLEMQDLAAKLLGVFSTAPHRDPTPVHARLAFGKQPGAKQRPQAPRSMTWLRRFARAVVLAVASLVGARALVARIGRR